MARARRGVATVITAFYTGRVGLGIEVENDRLALQVGQRDGVAVLVGEREVRGLVAGLKHAPEAIGRLVINRRARDRPPSSPVSSKSLTFRVARVAACRRRSRTIIEEDRPH